MYGDLQNTHESQSGFVWQFVAMIALLASVASAQDNPPQNAAAEGSNAKTHVPVDQAPAGRYVSQPQTIPQTVIRPIPVTRYQTQPRKSYQKVTTASEYVPVPFVTPMPQAGLEIPDQRSIAQLTPLVATSPSEDISQVVLQMLVFDVDAKTAHDAISATKITDENLSDIDVQLPHDREAKKHRSKKRKMRMRTFVIDGSLGKLFVADMKKRDDTFEVLSRPQIRTIVGTSATLKMSRKKNPASEVDGIGTIKIDITPKKIDSELIVNSHVTLIGPDKRRSPEEWTPEPMIEADASIKYQPGTSAVIVLGGKEDGRSIILLTDLTRLEALSSTALPVAQQEFADQVEQFNDLMRQRKYAEAELVAKKARGLKPDSPLALIMVEKAKLQRQVALNERQATPNAQPPQASPDPAMPTNSRLVTLQAITGPGVANGDTVDVLLEYAEDGDMDKAKVEMLCVSLRVYESEGASYDNTTPITLIADKADVEKLILGQLKGTLRLSVHKSMAQPHSQSWSGPRIPGKAVPGYSSVTIPPGTPIVFRENGTWGPPNAPIQASGVKSLQAHDADPVRDRPKSEVQQVLEEVREMRKMIQGLRNDMHQLRNSFHTSSVREAGEPAEIQLLKGNSRTIIREGRISRVDGFDTNILGVHTVSANSIRLFGHRPGRTTVKCYIDGDSEVPETIAVQVVTASSVRSTPDQPPPPKAAGGTAGVPENSIPQSPPQPVAALRGPFTEMQIQQGQLELIKPQREVVRVAAGATSIVEVTQYTPNEFGIAALRPGTATVLMWLKGEAEPIRVIVKVLPILPTAQDAAPYSATGLNEADAARRQIELALKKNVSIEIEDGTLGETLRQLHETAGINIVVDAPAIEAEGVSLDAKVSLHLSEASLRSTLKLLLDPLDLTTLIEDEVLKVTSQQAAKGKQTVAVYQVANLFQSEEDHDPDVDALIQLITNVIEPDSWQEVGGRGAVSYHPGTTSLIVRQTQEAHEEMRQLLAALKKWQPTDVQNKRLPENPAAPIPSVNRS